MLRKKDKYGYSVLHHAVYRNNLNLVTNLLEEKGLEHEATDEQGNTALHLAAQGQDPAMVAILMEHISLQVVSRESRVKGVNKEGRTPLHVAASTGCEAAVEVILGSEDSSTILEHRDSRGMTALLVAAASGNIETVNMIIEKGADIRVSSKDRETALHISSR